MREASFPPAPDAIVVEAVQTVGSRKKRDHEVRILTGAADDEVVIIVEGFGAVPRTQLTLTVRQARELVGSIMQRIAFADGTPAFQRRVNAQHEEARKAEAAERRGNRR